MGRLVDERRDDALHHVSQHSEGGDHDEIYEPWNPSERRSWELVGICNITLHEIQNNLKPL